VPGALFDTNVWLAVLFSSHPFHPIAQQTLLKSSSAQPAFWCRATQQNFLRLASTPALHRAYAVTGITNREALVAMDALQALQQVAWLEEPAGTESLWRSLAAADSASPKVWMDAYLAAFAMAAGIRLVTLDRDFKNFVPKGLDLVLLNP
jgi:toxin-antitoxin system PIN domain toxin